MTDEVEFAARPDEWTLEKGLRRLAISLAIRTVIVIAAHILFVWMLDVLAQWLANQPSISPIAGRIMFWPTAALGLAIGYIMAYKLCDAAGFESWWVAYAGLIALVLAAVTARALLLSIVTPPTILPTPAITYITVTAAMFSLWWHYFKNT